MHIDNHLVLLLSINLAVRKGEKTSLQGGQGEMFLKLISLGKIWLSLSSINVSFGYALKKWNSVCMLGTNLVILWQFLIPCAVKRRIHRDSGMPSRNQSRI